MYRSMAAFVLHSRRSSLKLVRERGSRCIDTRNKHTPETTTMSNVLPLNLEASAQNAPTNDADDGIIIIAPKVLRVPARRATKYHHTFRAENPQNISANASARASIHSYIKRTRRAIHNAGFKAHGAWRGTARMTELTKNRCKKSFLHTNHHHTHTRNKHTKHASLRSCA